VLDNPLGLGRTLDINASMADPVGIHTIALDLLLPTEGPPSIAGSYTYGRFWPALGLSARRTVQEVPSGLNFEGQNLPYRQLVAGVSGSVGLPIGRTATSSTDVSFGYDYTAYGPADPLPVADPTAPITVRPESGPDADVFVSTRFSNAQAWHYSISAQQGRTLSLYLRWSDPALGGRFHTTEVSWSWAEYLTAPWARLHVLALLYGGGIGIGDKRNFFSLGGYVQQDLVRSLFLNRRECCFFLRGYPENSFGGDQYQLFSAEYRAPVLWIEHGYSTFPLYLRRIWASAFFDAGNAYFGEFHPKTMEGLDVSGPLCGFEVFVDAVPEPKAKPTKTKPKLELSAFQAVKRDFAFVVDKAIEAGTLMRAALAADKKLITAVSVFDIFEGASLGADKKSIAIEVSIQPVEKTLTDEDFEALAKRIVENVGKQTGGVLRG